VHSTQKAYRSQEVYGLLQRAPGDPKECLFLHIASICGNAALRGEADQGRRQIRADSVENDPKRSLQLRRSTGIPALPNVKTACSRRGIVPAIASV
jgi:hypothetical protein